MFKDRKRKVKMYFSLQGSDSILLSWQPNISLLPMGNLMHLLPKDIGGSQSVLVPRNICILKNIYLPEEKSAW